MEAIAHDENLPTTAVCHALQVSRSAYYAWQTEATTEREDMDQELMPQIRKIFYQHKRRYGKRRIVEELSDHGIVCGTRRAARLLQIQGLKAIQPKSFKPRTTNSDHSLGYSPNLLLEFDEPDGINQLWVGDITYVPLVSNRFAYLAMLMDRFSRRMIGWKLSDDMTESLVTSALRQAVRERQPPPQLIHHTDRGGQYAAKRYRGILRRAEMQQSMSRAGNCYDNAFMESCFGTVKTELEMTEYKNMQTALKELRSYFLYYNAERKHSSLGYLTPNQFEQT